MINIRHVGIYVNDIDLMEKFYSNVFDMHFICRQQKCEGDFDLILGNKNSVVLMSKLITPKGVVTHEGDMVELLKVVYPKMENDLSKSRRICDIGTIHISFECEIEKTINKTRKLNGKVLIAPTIMPSGNSMCFISDPENNIIELIERRNSGE